MREISKTLFAAVAALAVLGVALSAPELEARPQYLKQFVNQYPALADAAKMKKCLVCHPGENNKNKKIRNDYGQAVGAGLGKDKDGNPIKNEKNVQKIEAALKKAEEATSKKTGKTFGEMIEDGKLPE